MGIWQLLKYQSARLRMTGSLKLRDLPVRCGPVFSYVLTDVCYWHLADIPNVCGVYVCFRGWSRHRMALPPCLLLTQIGLSLDTQ